MSDNLRWFRRIRPAYEEKCTHLFDSLTVSEARRIIRKSGLYLPDTVQDAKNQLAKYEQRKQSKK